MPGVNNSSLLVDFDVSVRGIALHRIFDVAARRDYLPLPSPFFKFAVNNGPAFLSDTGVSATVDSEDPDGSRLLILARSNDAQVGFELDVTLAWDSAVALLELTAVNLTPAPMFLRVVMPCIQGVSTPGDPAHRMGAVPKEAGSVVPLSNAHPWGTPPIPLGMPFIVDVGLPNGRNNMELVSVFDDLTGGGVFFCDVDGDLDNGIAPLQFTLDPTVVAGFWIGNIPANSPVRLPRLAIGVHPDGDWHRAVDYYTSVHRPRWDFPITPAWFRETAAIYTPSGGGAGGIYLSLPPVDLADTIDSFYDLPDLLEEAKNLGTNVLYLMDYWEGASKYGEGDYQCPKGPYFNKGDYIPRLSLGGEQALINGIELVHQAQGRVLLYLEPFTVFQYSNLGQNLGLAWGGRRWDGELWGLQVFDDIYPNYQCSYEMVAPFKPWQDYMVSTAERLVGQYGADGIMLDSYAWQMNRPMYNDAEKIQYSAQDYSNGVIDLVRRVRAAIQRINPEAVVIGETTAGPIARHWDGGLNADLGFGNIWACPNDLQRFTSVQRLTASPVRYGIPEVRIFGNGWNLNGLHQFFAAGHGLALCLNFPGRSFMYDNADHIRKLVQIRVTYQDALIYGAQINQPRTDNLMVIAYQYQGSKDRILMIVNIGNIDTTANISLDTPDPGGRWLNLLNHYMFFHTHDGVLENVKLTTGQGSLLVLLHTYEPWPPSRPLIE